MRFRVILIVILYQAFQHWSRIRNSVHLYTARTAPVEVDGEWACSQYFTNTRCLLGEYEDFELQELNFASTQNNKAR